jgi:protein TonB
MLRLRTSTSLSALALAIGIAGTGWLSTLTSVWQGSPAQGVHAQHRLLTRAHLPQSAHRYAPVSVVMHQRRAAPSPLVSDLNSARAATTKSPVELVPLTTPSDNSQPWYQLQGHLDGRVVLHLTIDGNGRVVAAGVRTSSGDPILDTHALRSVHQWRFAVPTDQPDGLSGDLSMRFASGRRDVASAT